MPLPASTIRSAIASREEDVQDHRSVRTMDAREEEASNSERKPLVWRAATLKSGSGSGAEGTQGRPSYRDKQLGDPPPNATGGIAQKRAIVFPPSNNGQRLACGVVIGVEGGAFATNLRIVDPERPPIFEVEEGWLADAKEVVLRGMLARALRLAGFESAAAYVAANGPIPKTAIRPRARLACLEGLRRAAELELRTTEPANRATFFVGERWFIGRQLSLNLSRQSEFIGPVSVTQGITPDFAERLLALDVSEERRDHLALEILETIPGIHIVGQGEGAASLEIGSVFRAELRLGPRTQPIP